MQGNITLDNIITNSFGNFAILLKLRRARKIHYSILPTS